MKKALFAACVALAVYCAPACAQDAAQKSPLPHITASGRAFIEVKPDIATLSLGVVSEKSTAAEATAENAQATTNAIAVLKSLGVDPTDIKTTSLTLAPVITEGRDPKTNALIKRRVTSYRASNVLQVRIRDVDKAGVIAPRVVVEGSANTYNGLSFSVSDEEAREDRLRAKAVGDAMRKAALYAQGAAMKLGRVLVIETEPDRNIIANADMPMLRAAPSPNVLPIPVEPGVTRIEVRVSGVWELLPE